MKIALVHKRLDLKGGTERDLFETAVGLSAAGHQVHCSVAIRRAGAPAYYRASRARGPLGRTVRLWSFALGAQKATRKQACDFVINFGRLIDADLLRCGGGTHRGFLTRMATHGGMGAVHGSRSARIIRACWLSKKDNSALRIEKDYRCFEQRQKRYFGELPRRREKHRRIV
jgi:hypothetical protein